ncbi:MAG: hypothetical protein M3Q76_09540 [Acidobacteriota bacterium]|nr:hypothetical protein [Acidobacteriota bacterium]
MFLRVLRFVRLPLVLIAIYAVMRFLMGPVFNQPYAPRGNAVFSVVGVTVLSSLIFGALSKRIGGFNWLGTILIGVVLGLFSQILIFAFTLISYAADINSYYTHWDALNVPEGTLAPMSQAMASRAGGLLFGAISGTIVTLIGRALLGGLAPRPAADSERLP